jgi:multidrug transporter EmrE-like cation transporter
MLEIFSRTSLKPPSSINAFYVAGLLIANIILNILANIGFKFSAESTTLRGFLIWQVFGNLAGLGTVIALTLLLRFLPLHIAFPVTTGLSLLGVQVLAAALYFNETITPIQWLGTLLIIFGVVFIWR